MTLRVGLIINPWSGVGGPAGLKGSDGKEIVAKAMSLGINPQSQLRVRNALQSMCSEMSKLLWFTAAGDMGENVLREMGIEPTVVGQAESFPSTAEDTERLTEKLCEQHIDVLLFAGGDGTARNIFHVVGKNTPVIGLPAGVKMHSGVYAVSPDAAALALVTLARGEAVAAQHAEVRDIDEVAFRQGQVKTRFYGEMLVPAVDELLQAVKSPGQAGEDEVLRAIADTVIETLEPPLLTILGPGSTTMAIADELGVDGTLLGVDVLLGDTLVFKDVSEPELFEIVSKHAGDKQLLVTAIGGQGHIMGRGNQQLSPRILHILGRDNVCVVASRQKLASLQGRPFVMDSGDSELNQTWAGPIRVICDYREQILYPIGRTAESVDG